MALQFIIPLLKAAQYAAPAISAISNIKGFNTDKSNKRKLAEYEKELRKEQERNARRAALARVINSGGFATLSKSNVAIPKLGNTSRDSIISSIGSLASSYLPDALKYLNSKK